MSMSCYILDVFRLDLAGENAVSLSANHLQKLRLSFQLATPLGHAFKPQQVRCLLSVSCMLFFPCLVG